MIRAIILFSMLVLPFCGRAQALQQIPHCPSGEVYDMMIDKKGFIWIAHNLGTSRFDGINFTSFSNPEQSSLSTTDLIEDKQGRIWFHNFNGQIFYIKDDKMVLLKEYDFRHSFNYPRMILYGNELVVSSNQGLFICNTSTLKCRYETIDTVYNKEITSLCVTNNKVLAFGSTKWYSYITGGKLVNLTEVDIPMDAGLAPGFKIQPKAVNDTALLINNVDGMLYGVIFSGRGIKTVFKRPIGKYINTISVINNHAWINTKSTSFILNGTDTIRGYDLTCIVADKEGNAWYSSLSNGLLVKYKPSAWTNVALNITGNDYIQCLQNIGSEIILGSRDGKIMSKAPMVDIYENIFTLPPQSGTTNNIQAAGTSHYFIETSNGLYLFNPLNRHVDWLESRGSSGIVVNGDTAFMATSIGTRIKDVKAWGLTPKEKIPLSIDPRNGLYQMMPGYVFIRKFLRCRAILIDTATQSLLISYSDGLNRLKNNKITPVLYNGKVLYVSSMVHYNEKIYAGTFNAGLFEIDSDRIRQVVNEVSPSADGIVKIKRCNNHIWIFRTHDIEVLDAARNKFIDMYPFPVDAPDVTDVEEDNDNIYLATHYGLYTMPLSASIDIQKKDPTLLYMLVNKKDTVYNNGAKLSSNRNNLLFKLAIPLYKDADRLNFKYRLINGDAAVGEDSVWYYTQDAQREIQFNALQPGNYSVEIIAVKDNEIISNQPLVYQFSISQPWFNTWWFYTVILLSAISIVLAVYQYRLRQVFKVERIRRKISNDLHDDIGSTLSSINVYSQLAKSDRDNLEYISTIQSNAVSVINNLDDLVWNINPKNDTLENVINRMRLFAMPIFSEKNIECVFKVKTDNMQLQVVPNVRADIYLLFKEAVNNVIKHSASTICNIFIIQRGKKLRLIIKDNGRGFIIKNVNPHRNGLRIMGERVKDIKGSIDIHSAPGSGTEIRITSLL